MIKITQEKIDKLYKFYEEIDEIGKLANEAVDLAKKNKDKTIEVRRKNGKKSKVAEGLLWEEIWEIGTLSEGYAILQNKYPEAFKRSEEFTEKSNEMKKFAIVELGIDTTKIKLTDIIRLVEAVIDFKYGNKAL